MAWHSDELISISHGNWISCHQIESANGFRWFQVDLIYGFQLPASYVYFSVFFPPTPIPHSSIQPPKIKTCQFTILLREVNLRHCWWCMYIFCLKKKFLFHWKLQCCDSGYRVLGQEIFFLACISLIEKTKMLLTVFLNGYSHIWLCETPKLSFWELWKRGTCEKSHTEMSAVQNFNESPHHCPPSHFGIFAGNSLMCI